MLAYAVLMASDFAEISSIVDVAGGQGKLLEKILEFISDITGTVFDTASPIERAKQGIGNDARPTKRTSLCLLLFRGNHPGNYQFTPPNFAPADFFQRPQVSPFALAR
jgi:hypothetical protein